MASVKLLQVKITPSLKEDIDAVALFKGIPVTSFIKLTLTEVVRKEKKHMFTENGLTEEQELEILHREKEVIEAYRSGKRKAKSGKSILKELNA